MPDRREEDRSDKVIQFRMDGGRVCCGRNPADEALSLYYYLRNWVFGDDELTMEEFIEWFFVYRPLEEIWTTNASQMQHLGQNTSA